MTDPTNETAAPQPAAGATAENPSFTKLAMRNMVRKGKLSLTHFGLTALGFLGFIVLVAYLGRPQLPGS
ncbi:DUF3285 domain-containing protein [Vulcanococcus sp. Clear-D1]|jgi:hypothetical protein|uniref:DUF3285 domain-containing protein n=1 Tax=Vulcanococcus sp. Clear-D1 TaxID=2766970 RepID=UPI001985525F|nr:DUF3285 domain-containing protein [Vulcanococcus sp. Clear-D1]MBD1195526.1 DUF3285 domain-containing protein [Vulcanococcus sp. Clear-D1]